MLTVHVVKKKIVLLCFKLGPSCSKFNYRSIKILPKDYCASVLTLTFFIISIKYTFENTFNWRNELGDQRYSAFEQPGPVNKR